MLRAINSVFCLEHCLRRRKKFRFLIYFVRLCIIKLHFTENTNSSERKYITILLWIIIFRNCIIQDISIAIIEPLHYLESSVVMLNKNVNFIKVIQWCRLRISFFFSVFFSDQCSMLTTFQKSQFEYCVNDFCVPNLQQYFILDSTSFRITFNHSLYTSIFSIMALWVVFHV